MVSRLILNKTEGTYFVYTNDYTSVLKELFEVQPDGFSRWRREDEIVFVPDRLTAYVMVTYERVR
jgi:hypothetical protein